MKLVIKERKKLNEEEKNSFEVEMPPDTFLELTLPLSDFQYVQEFITLSKKANKDPEELKKIALDLESKYNKEINPRSGFIYAEIGKNVIERAIALVAKHKNYNEEAAKIGLNIQYGKYQTYVTGHSGRATCLFAILSGIPKIKATINNITKEQLSNTEKIISQDFGFEKSKVPVNKINII